MRCTGGESVMVLLSQRVNTPQINAATLTMTRVFSEAPIIVFRLLPGSKSEKKKSTMK